VRLCPSEAVMISWIGVLMACVAAIRLSGVQAAKKDFWNRTSDRKYTGIICGTKENSFSVHYPLHGDIGYVQYTNVQHDYEDSFFKNQFKANLSDPVALCDEILKYQKSVN
jgi:hypothetical protein